MLHWNPIETSGETKQGQAQKGPRSNVQSCFQEFCKLGLGAVAPVYMGTYARHRRNGCQGLNKQSTTNRLPGTFRAGDGTSEGRVLIHRGFGKKGRNQGRGCNLLPRHRVRGGRSKKLDDLDTEFEEFYRRAQKPCLKSDVGKDWDLRVHEEVPPLNLGWHLNKGLITVVVTHTAQQSFLDYETITNYNFFMMTGAVALRGALMWNSWRNTPRVHPLLCGGLPQKKGDNFWNLSGIRKMPTPMRVQGISSPAVRAIACSSFTLKLSPLFLCTRISTGTGG